MDDIGYMRNPVIAAILFLLVFNPLWADRFALVIGNADYQHIQPLETPTNDAADIASALNLLKYNVDLRLNADLETMTEAVRTFAINLSENQNNEGFFWYAGHGIQDRDINYLLPVDFNSIVFSTTSTNEISDFSYSLNSLLNELQFTARNKVNVIILDACRNNPLTLGTRSISRGFAIAPEVQDTFIMYSTAAGATADDSVAGSRNSPFTIAFLMHMATQTNLGEVAKEIARQTIALTNSKQRPYISDNILFIRNYSLYPSESGIITIPLPEGADWWLNPASNRNLKTFSLDNTNNWSISLSYAPLTVRTNNLDYLSGVLQFSFLERYKERGARFFAPNAYYLSFRFGQNHFRNSTDTWNYFNFIPGIGVMWRFRPDNAQRMLLGLGISANIALGSLKYTYIDTRTSQKYSATDFLIEPMIGFNGNFTFRFAPLIAMEINAGYYLNILGKYTLKDNSVIGLSFFQAAIGISIIMPYGGRN